MRNELLSTNPSPVTYDFMQSFDEEEATPSVPGKPSDANTFERIEDKFMVQREHERWLVRTLQSRMQPAYPDPSTRYTMVQSLYFDSANLDVYASHFQSDRPRFKLRVRQYAPNGVWDHGLALLELKTKADGVSRKSRFALDDLNYLRLLRGDALECTGALQMKNAQMGFKRLTRLLTEINSLVERFGLRPRLSVIYTRRAFEADGVRVTLDTGIRSQLLVAIGIPQAEAIAQKPMWLNAREMRKSYGAGDRVLVEVKHPGTIPEWLRTALESISAEEKSFSKYCFCISQVVAAQVGPCAGPANEAFA